MNWKKSDSTANKPLYALTMGDPAGIGPEIAIKALVSKTFKHRVIIIGDQSILEAAARQLNTAMSVKSISNDFSDFSDEQINVLDLNTIRWNQFEPGKVSAQCGLSSFRYIEKSIELALQKRVAAVITNPINKKSLQLAGIHYPGHTEIFAEKTGTSAYSMLFLLRNVGVVHVTTHCSLRDAINLVSVENVLKNIRLLNQAMKRLGCKNPRIAVGGLNPHAGEHGLFGHEEIDFIIPAIKTAAAEGINVSGPYPPDTVFMRAFRGEFDGIVSMLHDHGFVALKSLDFEHGVNITVGLPIIRTSVGHGTAYDIAYTGKASPESLLSALDAAEKLYENRNIAG